MLSWHPHRCRTVKFVIWVLMMYSTFAFVTTTRSGTTFLISLLASDDDLMRNGADIGFGSVWSESLSTTIRNMPFVSLLTLCVLNCEYIGDVVPRFFVVATDPEMPSRRSAIFLCVVYGTVDHMPCITKRWHQVEFALCDGWWLHNLCCIGSVVKRTRWLEARDYLASW